MIRSRTRFDRERWLVTLLLASLGLWLVFALLPPAVPTDTAQERPNAVDPATESAGVHRPPPIEAISSYDAISARPLFVPDRKPYVAPAPNAVPAAIAPVTLPPPTDLRLSAIVNAGGKQIALIQRGGGSSTERVAVGGEISGWSVVAIEKGSVTLDRSGTRHTLTLTAARSPSGAPGGVAPGRVPGGIPGVAPGGMPSGPPRAVPGGT